MAACTPEVSSSADTLSRPSASTWKLTRMRAAPAAIGGMPRSSKRASERHSLTSSRSPCTTCTASAVCPSLKVVKSWALATGMVALRSMTRSTRPPMVSKPSDSGITSSSRISPSAALPASWLAWMAAPIATTSSGFKLVSTSRPNSSLTARRTTGMRVEPPTITVPCTSADLTLASRSTRLTAVSVLAISGWARASNWARVTVTRSSPASSDATSSVDSTADRASLAARAATSTARLSCAESRVRPASAQSARARSKSSPPRAASPPVATTSNTPRVRRSSEMSKVPPPRS
mmetsp:Transcript_21951/g.86055  ORF Transcript_21951/g.86055 Transcript_21951/m.86055 type:complete len:292 (+) Transcript_21951:2714-3589(+)